MQDNVFGFWENVQVTFNYLTVVKDSLDYTIYVALKYIDDIKYFPEVYDVWIVEVDLPDFCAIKCENDIMYFDTTTFDRTKYDRWENRYLPHNENPPRGWRSVNMADFHTTIYPRFFHGYVSTGGANLTFPWWSFAWNPIVPVLLHDQYQDGFMNHFHYGKYHSFDICMIVLRDEELLSSYTTLNSYVYKDYIIKKTTSNTDTLYVYDFLETKIPKIKMKNSFVPKWSYYNETMSKRDFLHHDFKSPAIITNNYFAYEVQNYYVDNIYSKFNPSVWKEGTQNLSGFYFVYYDYFGSPEPRWLTQFSFVLENVFHYFNNIYTYNTDLLLKNWDDTNSFFNKRGHPILMYLSWVEWDKIEDDNLIFRNLAEVKKR